MQVSLTEPGAKFLRDVQEGVRPPLVLTGSQVGTMAGFDPTDAMTQAQGMIVLDHATNPESVAQTLIVRDKMIISVRLDQQYAFDLGNILVFANDQPFLWMIFDTVIHKQKIDTIAHFAGDEYFVCAVINYPYIRKLIAYNPMYGLHANFLHIPDLIGFPEANTVRSQQMIVEHNTLYNGRGQTILAAKKQSEGWYASPLGFEYGEDYGIDGGRTVRGV